MHESVNPKTLINNVKPKNILSKFQTQNIHQHWIGQNLPWKLMEKIDEKKLEIRWWRKFSWMCLKNGKRDTTTRRPSLKINLAN